jgi:hypothetical protein
MANSQNGARAIKEHVFNNLLASAYSLQQRHDRMKSISGEKSRELIACVLDIQKLLGRGEIHSDTAMHLIASRSQKMCGAAGTAIALVDGENLNYRAATGIAESLLGSKILADTSFSFQELKSGGVIQSDTWKDKALGTRVMAKSVLSAPILHNGKLVGCIQLFSRMGRFGEESSYACELMSTVMAQLVEDPEFLSNGDRDHDLNPQTVRKPSQESILGSDLTLEVNEGLRSQPIPSKQRLRWPPSDTRPEDLTTSQVNTKLSNQPPETEKQDFSRRPNNGNGAQTQNPSAAGEQATRWDAWRVNHLPIARAGLEANDNRPDSSCQPSKTSDDKWTRVTAMLYPGLVLLFVAMAVTSGGPRDWPLELATVIIVCFSAVEVWRRWRDY